MESFKFGLDQSEVFGVCKAEGLGQIPKACHLHQLA